VTTDAAGDSGLSAGARLARFISSVAPADTDALTAAGRRLGIEWPPDFIDYMAITDGGEGWVGPCYLAMLPLTDLQDVNETPGVAEVAPYLVIFGSDGGGEYFAFDTRTSPPAIVMFPDIGLSEGVLVRLGLSLADLVDRLLDGGCHH
jgi:hypothetical protein